MISIITPTHSSKYLVDAWNSLQTQTYTDWEWVLVPNGDNAAIPDVIRQDVRVHVYPYSEKATFGALKKFA